MEKSEAELEFERDPELAARVDRSIDEPDSRVKRGRLSLAGEMVTGEGLRVQLGLEADEAEALAERIEHQHAHPEEARPVKPRVPRDEL